MDEQQIQQVIREVLARTGEGGTLTWNVDSSCLPKAYFIFPKNRQSGGDSSYLPALKADIRE